MSPRPAKAGLLAAADAVDASRVREPKYLKDTADVIVTFTDGEVKEYRISAGPGVGGYLAREASANGILHLFNKNQSWGIPIDRIRDWEIRAVLAIEPVESEDPK